MGKGGAKVGTVEITLLCRSWVVKLVTPRAKNVDRIVARQIRQADRDHRLTMAVDPRAPAKLVGLKLFVLFWSGEGGGRGWGSSVGSPRIKEAQNLATHHS